jgi:phage tail-like protein
MSIPPPFPLPVGPFSELPLPAHRFIVTLDPGDAYLPADQAALLALVSPASFATVDGLGAKLTVTAYGEGGRNDYHHQLPVRHQWPPIVLGRGVVRDLGLLFWYEASLSESIGARRDGAIIMLSELGIPAIAWIFRNGLATAWTGPKLAAGSQAVAIESIEITHEGLLQVPLTPPGTP